MILANGPRAIRRPLRVLISTAIVALLGAGCTSEAPSTGDITLESAVGYTPDGWDRLKFLEEESVKACMRREGFRFVGTSDADRVYLTQSPHGLFDLLTPQAENRYLAEYGYGLAQKVVALRAAAKLNRRETDDEYFNVLPRSRQQAFVDALNGIGATPGCVALAKGVKIGLPLPYGGKLGKAYGDALSDMYDSGEYEDWQRGIAKCMRARGIAFDGDDPGLASEPLLIELLGLTKSKYSRDSEGRIHYSMVAARIPERAFKELPDLRKRELATAKIELTCRRAAWSEIDEMVKRHSASTIRKFPAEMETLKKALQRATTER